MVKSNEEYFSMKSRGGMFEVERVSLKKKWLNGWKLIIIFTENLGIFYWGKLGLFYKQTNVYSYLRVPSVYYLTLNILGFIGSLELLCLNQRLVIT